MQKSVVYKQTEIGDIPEDWKVETMAQICDVVTDYVANGSFASLKSHVKYNDVPDYAILVRLADYNKNFQGDFVYVNKEGYEYLKKSKLVGGEIIISNVGEYSGTVFKTPFLKQPMTLGPNSITIKTKHNDSFFYYWLTSIYGQSAINDIKGGSAVPKFNKTDFKTILAPCPPINEQQQIASMLSSLDDKIELNKKMNKTLEEIGKALFKRWFVDFEFLDDEGKPYKSSGGKMVDSEFGEVPKGWSVGKLADEFIILMGQSPPGNTYNDEGAGLPFYQGRADFGDRYPTKRIYCSVPARVAHPNDTLLSVRAPVGDINQATEECCIGRGVAAISKKGFSSYTFYKIFYLRRKFQTYDQEGTVFGSITKDDLAKIAIVIPQLEVVRKYEYLLCEIDKQIYLNISQINLLSNIRDSLLPRLMSGKLRTWH